MQVNLTEGLLWYIVFLYSTTCHEASHAWAALRLGDDTACKGGQVSLNPWPHLKRSPIGMFVVPVLCWLLGGMLVGWASAPYNAEWARKFPRRAGLMAIAGPAANLALVIAAALLIRVGVEWGLFVEPFQVTASRVAIAPGDGLPQFLAHALSIVLSLNLLLLVFNLVPIPPLDGSKIPLLFLPEKVAARFYSVLDIPFVRIIGLVLIFKSSPFWFSPLLGKTASFLYLGCQNA